MRLTATVSISYKILWVAMMVFGTGAVSIYCLWMMVNGATRYTEQQYGAKTGHRQIGLSVLKDITRDVSLRQKSKLKIVDPPVDGEFKAQPKEERVEFDAIRRVYPEEYALRDVSKLTSSTKSSYRIKGDRQNVQLGDTLHVVIQARDSRSKDREEGGDFWFATLATKQNSSGTAGRIIDHDNGTYSAYFTVGWPGSVALEVTLVHPSHVAAVMTSVIWNERDRVEWTGRFQMAPNSTIKSDRRCLLRRQYVPLISECVMTYPKAMGQTVLVCDAPEKGIPCSGLNALYPNLTAVNDRIKSFTRNYYQVFSGDYFKRRLTRGPSKLLIKASEHRRKKLMRDQESLPACQPDQSSPSHGLGYWEKNIWHSHLCRTKESWNNPSEIGECFRSKEVFFLGDPVMRRWMEILSGMMGFPFLGRASEDEDVHIKLPSLNSSLTFLLQSLTFSSKGTPHLKPIFEADILDFMRNKGCNYVVAMGSWAHFSRWTRESFVERVGLLREAVVRLKTNCPAAKVVVAGPHPLSQPNKESRIHVNDLIIHNMGEILEDAFSQSGALYLDRWDLNVGYPSSKKLHMPTEVIQGEFSIFLSYVCGEGDTG